jgi:hypothetical protein
VGVAVGFDEVGVDVGFLGLINVVGDCDCESD